MESPSRYTAHKSGNQTGYDDSYGFLQKTMNVSAPFPAKLGYGIYDGSDNVLSDFNVIIAPGMHRSHIYYHKLARWIARAGGTTFSLDWLGQGNSINDPLSKHKLKGYPMECHASHFRKFVKTALKKRNALPTYIIGHSWGSLPILKAMSESSHHDKNSNTHIKSEIDSLNIAGLCFFTPFFEMNNTMRRYMLHHVVDIAGKVPPLRNTALQLRRGGLAHKFLIATMGADLCDETEIRDKVIQDIDEDFQKKSISIAFLHEARSTQKKLMERVQELKFNFPVSIISAEKETLVCNTACQEWAEYMDAAYLHLDHSKHSDLYDLPDDMKDAPLAKALEWAGLPPPSPKC